MFLSSTVSGNLYPTVHWYNALCLYQCIVTTGLVAIHSALLDWKHDKLLLIQFNIYEYFFILLYLCNFVNDFTLVNNERNTSLRIFIPRILVRGWIATLSLFTLPLFSDESWKSHYMSSISWNSIIIYMSSMSINVIVIYMSSMAIYNVINCQLWLRCMAYYNTLNYGPCNPAGDRKAWAAPSFLFHKKWNIIKQGGNNFWIWAVQWFASNFFLC